MQRPSDPLSTPAPGAAAPSTGTSGEAPKGLKDSLHLPRTSFAMRGNLGEKEPKQLAAWAKADLRGAIAAARKGAQRFVLHDGPPYANGALHHGHILNKVLKDLVVKDRTMRGLDVSYVPGWDCHGLPIEVQVDKELKGRARSLPPVAVHEACSAYAARFVQSQGEGFARLGVFADWSKPYRTMDPGYEAQIVREFGRLIETGCVYRGLRPVHWCTVHQTALAEAEIEYETKRSPSIYVAFRLDGTQANNQALQQVTGPIDVVIWTTTPWSLPGNVAVTVHPEATYLVARFRGRHVVVAEKLWPAFVAASRREGVDDGDAAALAASPQVAAKLSGSALAGLTYAHPFLPRQGVVLLDEAVALDTGTGAVHNAPAHGAEDFEVAQRHNLEIPCPVNGAGVLTDGAGPFAGMPLAEAAVAIVAHLDGAGALMNRVGATLEHRYAHCWRCHKPIITRATQQWFLALDCAIGGAGRSGQTLRQEAVAALETVTWVPQGGIERIRGMLKGRPDWCLSRQRVWGVPVPVAYCNRCETPLLDAQAVEKVAKAMDVGGARAWYTAGADVLFAGKACAACGHTSFRQENDILDVWFDSGTSHAAVLEAQKIGHDAGAPADLYLEGSDQHRGWFHSSLLTSVASRGRAPYRQVLTHGFVVDGNGKKLSKSLGNAADPFVAVQKDGAELFRLWVASEDYQQDVRISPVIMRQVADHYRKLRNTVRYLLGNLHGFAPGEDAVTYDQLRPIDRYMLLRHRALVQQVEGCFAAYQFHTGVAQLLTYCGGELSAFYLDVLKDRLYADGEKAKSRLAAQTVLYVVARDLLRLLAPVLCFTAEEAWQLLPRAAMDHDSVHLMHYPSASQKAGQEPAFVVDLLAPRSEDAALLAQFAQLMQLRSDCLAALEEARRDKKVGSSTEAKLVLTVPDALKQVLATLPGEQLADFLIVSEVVVVLQEQDQAKPVEVQRADGEKCPRCWLYRKDLRAHSSGQAVCTRCSEALQC